MYDLYNVIKLDKLRIYKLFEIAEYCFIFMIIIYFITYIINKFYFKQKSHSKNITLSEIFKQSIIVYFELLALCIILFYTIKIGKIFPSIIDIYNAKYKSYTTLNYSMHIAIIVLMIELLPNFKSNIELLMDMLLDYF